MTLRYNHISMSNKYIHPINSSAIRPYQRLLQVSYPNRYRNTVVRMLTNTFISYNFRHNKFIHSNRPYALSSKNKRSSYPFNINSSSNSTTCLHITIAKQHPCNRIIRMVLHQYSSQARVHRTFLRDHSSLCIRQ